MNKILYKIPNEVAKSASYNWVKGKYGVGFKKDPSGWINKTFATRKTNKTKLFALELDLQTSGIAYQVQTTATHVLIVSKP